MANSSNHLYDLPAVFKETDYTIAGVQQPLAVYRVDFDTINTDLTIYTPSDAKNYLAIVGWQSCKTAANTVKIFSGTSAQGQDALATLDLAGNQLISHRVEGPPLFIMKQGKSIVMQVSAQPATFLLHVVEFRVLRI